MDYASKDKKRHYLEQHSFSSEKDYYNNENQKMKADTNKAMRTSHLYTDDNDFQNLYDSFADIEGSIFEIENNLKELSEKTVKDKSKPYYDIISDDVMF